MALVRVAKIGSKRQEAALERIATALEGILELLQYDLKKPLGEEMQVTTVEDVGNPDDPDESAGIEG